MDYWYKDGLRFGCTQCHACCRHDPGYVFLSREDLSRLAEAQALSEQEFLNQYCRTVRMGDQNRISLNEKANYDCIFWDGGCTVYEARPLQCRSFPFWEPHVRTPGDWERLRASCPGIGQGEVHGFERIRRWIDVRNEADFGLGD